MLAPFSENLYYTNLITLTIELLKFLWIPGTGTEECFNIGLVFECKNIHYKKGRHEKIFETCAVVFFCICALLTAVKQTCPVQTAS